MKCNDEILENLGFERKDTFRWEHKEYYPKYYFWLSTSKGYPNLLHVIHLIEEKAEQAGADKFKRDIIGLFALPED